ncbi:MAG: hypothetical protein F6Q13_16110 [Mycobacterium sp.]|nr:MAG: hypothetical protein F6Q13_16110 [Mycobacterium sp.]
MASVGADLGAAISSLTAALSGTAGMAGDDPAGATLGRSYDRSAGKLLEAMATTRNGLCRLGDGVRISAHNYSVAEAFSDISGRSAALSVPPSTGSVAAGAAPSAVGRVGSVPAGWGWVAPYLGMIWPTGDSGRLRAAAAAWAAAGNQFEVSEVAGSAAPMATIRAQLLPEGAAIDAAFSDALSATTGIAEQCESLAQQLSAYAAKVDRVHGAVLDLLSRICNPLTGLKEVWDFLTARDEDEIKKIADDIRTVIATFTEQADALGHRMVEALQQAAAVATAMADYADKEWDRFVHGTQVGRVVNQLGQVAKGAGAEVGGMAETAWDYSQLRMVLDPKGYVHDLQETAQGIAPLVGLGGDGAPGIGQAWTELGKQTVHWDEWGTNPAEAAGRSAVDLATLPLPGGSAAKLGKLGRGAREMVDGLKDTRLPELPPPHNGEPDAAPPQAAGKPTSAPPETAPPSGPTETKTQPAQPAPAGAPSAPAGHTPHTAPSQEPSAPVLPTDATAGDLGASPQNRTNISGHGAYGGHGMMQVPPGSTITTYAEHGSTITDALGNLIETSGDTSGLYSKTFLPGESLPDYTIYPPDGLNITGDPQTVTEPTLLSELIKAGMGDVHLATCTFDPACPTGKVYDVSGIFDWDTGVLNEYGGQGF